MDVNEAIKVCANNYIINRVAQTCLTVLSDPRVQIALKRAIKRPEQVEKLTLVDLLDIFVSLPYEEQVTIEKWLIEESRMSMSQLMDAAKRLEDRLPQEAEALRVLIVDKIQRWY